MGVSRQVCAGKKVRRNPLEAMMRINSPTTVRSAMRMLGLSFPQSPGRAGRVCALSAIARAHVYSRSLRKAQIPLLHADHEQRMGVVVLGRSFIEGVGPYLRDGVVLLLGPALGSLLPVDVAPVVAGHGVLEPSGVVLVIDFLQGEVQHLLE